MCFIVHSVCRVVQANFYCLTFTVTETIITDVDSVAAVAGAAIAALASALG